MTYDEVISTMKNMDKFGKGDSIEVTQQLLNECGNPEKKIRFVHIAGTNGKGSVSNYLTSIFVENNNKVGTFNSPSVFSYNERFLFCGRPIDNKTLKKILLSVLDKAKSIENDKIKVNAFQIELVVALLWFEKMQCDIVVLETGLGGAKDPTNVIPKKEIAIITQIGLDHTKILGDNIESIAKEKFGIVKDCPLIVNKQNSKIDKVFTKSNELVWTDDIFVLYNDLEGQKFLSNQNLYQISMLGFHQIENANLAIQAMQILNAKGFAISNVAIKEGLKKAKLKGRFQVEKHNGKTFVFDGAHNESGIIALIKSLKVYFKDKKISIIFGMLKDKDFKKAIEILAKENFDFYSVTVQNDRALNAQAISQEFEKQGKICKPINMDKPTILNINSEVVCICGSLAFIDITQKIILH